MLYQEEGEQLLNKAIQFKLDYDNLNEKWSQWKFSVDIKLFLHASLQEKDEHQEPIYEEGKYTLQMPFGHIAVLLKDDGLLSALLQSKPDYKYWIDHIVEIQNGSDNAMDFKGQDAWVLKANCLHFASRFYPEALHVILSFFEAQGTKEKLIFETHDEGMFSPLHCAATQPESIGTR